MPIIRDPAKGPSSVFALATPQHMLTKLGWEIRLLEESLSPKKEEDFPWPLLPAYHAFNCAVTAWHLIDWTWHASNTELQDRLATLFDFTNPSSDRKGFDRFADSIVQDCRALHLCRVIANGSKHMKVGKPDPDVLAQIRWGEGPNYIQEPFIADGTTGRPALEVFREAMQYWERLLSSVGFIEGMYISAD